MYVCMHVCACVACGQLALEREEKSKVSPLHLLGKQIGADLSIGAYAVANADVTTEEVGAGTGDRADVI